jgi:cysteine-rich repeat protein
MSAFHPIWLAVLLGLGPGCEAAPWTESPCGNRVIDPGEQCDRDDLAGQTCATVLPGTSGTLLCHSDCTLFTGLCLRGVCGDGALGPDEGCDDGNNRAGDGCSPTCEVESPGRCGNGNRELGETCDDGNLFSGDGCSADCQLEPPGICGDGIVDWNEGCDGLDLGGATCEALGLAGGVLRCNAFCWLDPSGCGDCALGEAVCAGSCTDVLATPGHCGGCDQACDPGEACVGGTCLGAVATWVALMPGPGDASAVVAAHDLVEHDGKLVLAWVERVGDRRKVWARSYDPASGEWFALEPGPSGDATDLDDAVALARGQAPGTDLLLAYGAAASGVHVVRWDLGWWAVGSPWDPGSAACQSLDLVTDDGTIEVLTTGLAPGGGAVQHVYRFWGWQTHPAPDGLPGQVSAHAAGRPALRSADRTYVAVAEQEPERTTHRVRFWDEDPSSWTPLGPALDLNDATGWQEDLALDAGADGTLWVAWSESDGADPPVHDVLVKRYDPDLADWVLVGGGPVNPAPGAVTPSIRVLGPTVWVAYAEASGATSRVTVRRLDAQADTWADVGGPLNEDPAQPAEAPVIAGCRGVPYVVFREQGRLHVRFLDPGSTPGP